MLAVHSLNIILGVELMLSIMQKRNFKFRFDFLKYVINYNFIMLHNVISNRCYVKYSTITTEYSDTYNTILGKILSDTSKKL